ncbi:unnamed protein product, partial [Sphenostylis stenocarpa]
ILWPKTLVMNKSRSNHLHGGHMMQTVDSTTCLTPTLMGSKYLSSMVNSDIMKHNV